MNKQPATPRIGSLDGAHILIEVRSRTHVSDWIDQSVPAHRIFLGKYPAVCFSVLKFNLAIRSASWIGKSCVKERCRYTDDVIRDPNHGRLFPRLVLLGGLR